VSGGAEGHCRDHRRNDDHQAVPDAVRSTVPDAVRSTVGPTPPRE